MKFKPTRMAAAIGLCAIAGSAFALPTTAPYRPLTNYTSGTTDLYLVGSSAVDLALTKLIAQRCLPNTLDVYRDDAGGKTYYLFTCEADGTSGTFAMSNTKIAIHKYTNSSSDGVNLVANGAATASFLNVSDLTPSSFCAVPFVNGGGSPAYNLATCNPVNGATTAGAPTSAGSLGTFGFADSEPNQYNSGVSAQLQTSYPFSIIQGIPVTQNLRDALQTAQGLTAGDETEAGMPSIAAATINSIFLGKYSTWSTAIGVNPGVDTIYRTIRSSGSGTTRAFNATFIGSNCTPNLTPVSTGAVAITTPSASCTASNTFTQAGTSDDMASCLTDYNSAGVSAIGYLSTDYTPAVGTDGYRWVKVDGYSPKLANVASNKWKMWSELSFNYNKASGLSADQTVFYNSIKSASNSLSFLSGVVTDLAQTSSGGWTGGIIGAVAQRANPNGFGVTPPALILTGPRADSDLLANPANPLTRGATTGYNLCSEAYPVSGYLPR